MHKLTLNKFFASLVIMREKKLKEVLHFEKCPVYGSMYHCMATAMCTNF